MNNCKFAHTAARGIVFGFEFDVRAFDGHEDAVFVESVGKDVKTFQDAWQLHWGVLYYLCLGYLSLTPLCWERGIIGRQGSLDGGRFEVGCEFDNSVGQVDDKAV